MSPDRFSFVTIYLLLLAGKKDASECLDNMETMPFDATAVILPEEHIPSKSPDVSAQKRRDQYQSVKPPKSSEPTHSGKELDSDKIENFSDTDAEAWTAGLSEKVIGWIMNQYTGHCFPINMSLIRPNHIKPLCFFVC